MMIRPETISEQDLVASPSQAEHPTIWRYASCYEEPLCTRSACKLPSSRIHGCTLCKRMMIRRFVVCYRKCFHSFEIGTEPHDDGMKRSCKQTPRTPTLTEYSARSQSPTLKAVFLIKRNRKFHAATFRFGINARTQSC